MEGTTNAAATTTATAPGAAAAPGAPVAGGSTKLSKRESDVFMAKLAEQAERYDEMAEYMKLVAKDTSTELSIEERNLLSVAFKNAVGQRRGSLRIIASILHKQRKCDMQAHAELAEKYHKEVEKELKDKCNDVLELLDKNLIGSNDLGTSRQIESAVFYLKMKGDYYRYLSEFCEESRLKTMESSKEAYDKAHTIAFQLSATHPIRLGLALNYSVFLYEIMNDPDQACVMAKSSFDDAIAELDSAADESYKDATLIMQLLRDNLTLWNAEGLNNEGGEPRNLAPDDEEAGHHL